jgi:hypothetical protein
LDTRYRFLGLGNDDQSGAQMVGLTPTFLLTWNPDRWPWNAAEREDSRASDRVSGRDTGGP